MVNIEVELRHGAQNTEMPKTADVSRERLFSHVANHD